MNGKGSEADGPDKGDQTSPIPGRLAYQGPVSERSTSEHSLGWIIYQEKSELKPTQVFSFVGYEYHLDSALVKPTQERWLKIMTKVKTYFDCKMFEVADWVACLNRVNDPRGTPSHETLSVSPQGALEICLVVGQPSSLDRDHYSTSRVLAEYHKT